METYYTLVLLAITGLLTQSSLADDRYMYCPPSSPHGGQCCERFGLNVYHDASVDISASSSSTSSGANHGPDRAALFQVYEAGKGIGGWAPAHRDAYQWIQVDLGYPRRVAGVLLQGRSDCCDQWVTSYRVLFSNDLRNFYSTPTIEGTFDRDSVTRRYFDQPFVARYVRINPVTWVGHPTLRFDLLGCSARQSQSAIVDSTF